MPHDAASPAFHQHPGLLPQALKDHPRREQVRSILAAALEAADPSVAMRRFLRLEGERLFAGESEIRLAQGGRVWVVGAGKAGDPMARTAASILVKRLAGGVVIVKEGHLSPEDLHGVTLLEAGHPLPDERGVRGATAITDLLRRAGEKDVVLCLLSGGGSALLTAPAEGVTLSDLQALTALLLASGASIHEINTLRKHLEELKGGCLARLAAPRQVVSLVLSDVVGDQLDVIASGPTVPDPTTFAEAREILARYSLLERTPPAILHHLERGVRGEIADTPKPGDPLFARVTNVIIGSNRTTCQAACQQASRLGFHSLLLTTHLQGEAHQVGRVFASIARELHASGSPLPRPACVVAGGETTVRVRGEGLGGRNQEFVLGAVADLKGLPQVALLSMATDGGDGPTDAAGAAVTGESYARALQMGMSPEDFLERNDAYHFFARLGDLLKPGPTQTNVNDIVLLFAF